MALPSYTISILQNVYEQLIKGQEIEPFEIQAYTKEGTIVWVLTTPTLIRLCNEILIQVIAQDITESKLKVDIQLNK